ncbi:alpha/beta hydrolase [Streptomyces sp. SID13031]|uniref:alpha/beta fold hydrolase n=1 Tax=Streptomyces sp. SID13031 TaxID=2706046 RepID=UPI0013C88180|nr:alpha/beta hydrolase [Streptomyces sp. SID13031]NEA37444.1 alpha/beta hydrolase [Streptomyces sp. SID13031]
MFDGFQLERVKVGEVSLRVRHGGSGPAVVLLHGHPRTHTTWYQVAPALATEFTVVCPDLRGYGQSDKPAADEAHTQYSKRSMAQDVVRLMTELGHERFAVVGHDRGSYVAYRTALDHPDRVSQLVVMDGVPVVEALERCDDKFAAMWWHWWFFAQTAKPAERVICADPETWYNAWTSNGPDHLGPENHADFLAAIRNPATVHAMLEDYRAGLGVDRQADEADRTAGRQITCPTLMLWSTQDDMEDLYGNPLDVWRPWCPQITGHGINSPHHIAENAPKELVQSLRDFLL